MFPEEPADRGEEQRNTSKASACRVCMEHSHEAASLRKPQRDLQKSTCPQCGNTVSDIGVPPVSSGLDQQQNSSLLVESSRSSGSKVPDSQQPSASDTCLQLLLACLFCQGSALLLGLLEACSCCLHTLCSSCCHACTRCCSAVHEVPVEEFSCHAHCHSVLFESCCEPIECLEFCLDCCEICHRS